MRTAKTAVLIFILQLGNMQLINLSKPGKPINIVICTSFISKFKGLMFQPGLDEQEGIALVSDSSSIVNSSIHMFFMNFDIAVIWLDSSMHVIDKTIAQKWHPYYAPKNPAQYTIELHPLKINDFNKNDQVQFKDA
jgi:uncharacterized membrane protein (UPF0127 family)